MRIATLCLILLILAAAKGMATEPYLEEDFSSWPATSYYRAGIYHQNNWRFFSVGGAGGRLKRIPSAQGAYIRISRDATTTGDTGLDLDQPDQTVLLSPGMHLQARVWARSRLTSATLDLRLAEYHDLQWTGKDNAHQFALTNTFAPYGFDLTTSGQTNRVNLAVRALPGQTIEVSRIELLPVEAAASRQPRILLPQGWTPNAQPTLWWRAPGHAQFQVQLASDIGCTTTTWDSGTRVSGSNHLVLPAQTAGQRVFARVRVQDLNASWGAWSDPTLINYDPLPQLPAQDLYVYSYNDIFGLSAAQCYEQGLLIAALQGLANRQSPRLYLLAAAYSQDWLDKLRQPGRWLEHVRLIKNPGAQGFYEKIQTSEGPALRLTRGNMTGDTGVDHGVPALAVTVTSNTTIQVTCRARAASPGSILYLSMAEHDAQFTFLGLNNDSRFNPGESFQDYTYSFTASPRTRLINPAIRVGNIGGVEVRSLRLNVKGESENLFEEDFETWAGGPWQTPGFWNQANGWRIFGANAPDIVDLVNRFKDVYAGVVLWDPAVPATSNVAVTIAGAENLLPIPLRDEPGSLYRLLVTGGPKLPVKRSLVGLFTGTGTIPGTNEASSGSAKNDAYRWAIINYLKTGQVDPQRFGYYVDAFGGANNVNMNYDFFIMKKGFLWDLSVWDDETPIDDPHQPLGTDVATLKRMFGTAAQLRPNCMIQCGGFPPFAIKYSNYSDASSNAGGRHEPVPTEWKCAETLSSYNVELEADGAISNCSVFTHMPRPVRVNQVPPPLIEDCRDAGWITADNKVAHRAYILHYVGDYDSPCWLNTFLPPFWDNGLRGRVLVNWAWDPNMCERGMPQFDEYMRTRTPNDALWAGDSGAGYTNPNQLLSPRVPSGLPDAGQAWKDHCAYWFRIFDVRQTGFIINGNKEPSTDPMRAMYESFSGDGLVDGWTTGEKMIGTVPVVRMKNIGLPDDPTAAAQVGASLATAEAASFVPLRSILKDPSYYYQVNRNLRVNYPALNPAFVSPSEFFYLLRYQLSGKNHYRAAFLGDTVASGTLAAGRKTHRKLWLRNLGWQTWPATGAGAVRVGVELASADQRQAPTLISLPSAVEPGQMVEIEFDLDVPSTPGPRYWRIDLCEGDSTWFGDHGNLPESRLVQVGPPTAECCYDWKLFK